MTNETTSKRQRRMARKPKSDATANGRTNEAGSAPREARETGAKKPNKTENVLALLNRTHGATLDELVEATGWLPHSARAALTGLKKKGHAIEWTRLDGVSRYAIIEPVTQ